MCTDSGLPHAKAADGMAKDGAAPQFSQFARTRGWWTNAVSRQDSALFLSSGYWGVERIDLQ